MNIYPNNILVTGGMGFIGSHFIAVLLNNNKIKSVINLDKLTYAANKENLNRFDGYKKYKFIHGDICNEKTVNSIFKENDIDTVVNFAAESHVDNSISAPQNFIDTNIVGTSVLLECSKKYWDLNNSSRYYRFHQVSTDEVYGSIGKGETSLSESALYNPSSPYSASKASADHLVTAYYKTYGMPITISLCSNNYGSFQHYEKFIPVVINSCVNQTDIPIYGDGSNIRDWINVNDHCEAILSILIYGRLGEKYNIPGGFEISNIDLAKMICDIYDKSSFQNDTFSKLKKNVPDRLGHDWRYSISGEKLAKDCNWKPKIQFDAGLSETVQWYLSRISESDEYFKNGKVANS